MKMSIKDLHGARVVKINGSNQIYLPKKLNYKENDTVYVKKSKDKKSIILMDHDEFKHQAVVFEHNMRLKKDMGKITPEQYRRQKRNFYSKTFVDQVKVDSNNKVVLSEKYADADTYFARPKNKKKK